MAGIVVTCPECEKKFKPKADVSGKKIKCPFCTHQFVVPGEKAANGDAKSKPMKSDKARPDAKAKPAGKGKPDTKPKPVAEPTQSADPDLDKDENPYGVNHVELVPRCPNCTEEMENEHATICLYCGYNTMTREWGKTEKTIGVTWKRQILYSLPAIGSATYVFFTIIFLIYYCVVSPYDVEGTMMSFSDHESMRMWTTVVNLVFIWAAGMFCFQKFIAKPKPDEIKLD
ncbi:MAG TPA: hypothetical protein VFE62_30490 [Gemmataceae bacterium]|nr:hypothetical protein [Gemmataceae bacterium]